ncbi:cell envelope integrity protein TolA, partial [Arenibaculum sp.]|uniref:cell envelope integrity protein TolA n=1 Tax=Arenibaculum sp. TaxID=2865862 RepID=UPI002E12618F|nr:cell envelope integrity protein TolA [Arenibaculum sp.]
PTALVMPAQPIPVDIVDIGEITNTRIDEAQPAPTPPPRPAARPAPPAATPPPAAATPEPPPVPTPRTPEPPTQLAQAPRVPEPPTPPPPAQQPKPEPPKPEPAKPEPAKPELPKAEPAKPEPPKPEPPKVEPPKPKPQPPKPEPKKPEPAKPEPAKPEPPKPEPKKEPEKPQFQNLLKDLTKREDPPAPEEAPETEVADAPDTPSNSAAPRLSDRLSISEMDAVRRQVSGCWLVDPGLPNVRDIVVEIRVRIGQDRTVESAEIVDAARMRSDRVFRTVAEGALRAVRNPRCNPLELPPDRYDTWRDTVFVFSPRDVL